jgi:alkaline phosphatase
VALEFYKQHPDETLIVVTADHETGGMALGNTKYVLDLKQLQHQHCSAWALSDEVSNLYGKNKPKPKWEQIRAIYEQRLDFYDGVTITDEEDAMLKAAFKKTLKKPKDRAAIKTLYKDIDALSGIAVRLLNKKSQLGWSTYSHTAAAVPVFAIGQGAERFTGWQDNTEIAPKILKITQNE